jgi:hypothetical protein
VAPGVNLECFFARRPGAGACDGALIRAHLIPAQRIKREYPRGAYASEGQPWVPVPRDVDPELRRRAPGMFKPLDEIVWDPRVWVPLCGGPTGIGGHHGKFDGRSIRLRREDLPAAVEEFAAQYGLGWSLERDYGPKET